MYIYVYTYIVVDVFSRNFNYPLAEWNLELIIPRQNLIWNKLCPGSTESKIIFRFRIAAGPIRQSDMESIAFSDTSATFPAFYRSKNQQKKQGFLQYKKTGGKMMLMFVPEVATGRYQVNDTHWHQPLKDEARALAAAWYQERMISFANEMKPKDPAQVHCRSTCM